MAKWNISLTEDRFTCALCLDQLRDSSAFPCGHSFCLRCITGFWGQEDKIYRCPQCRQSFTPKPSLLVKVMEKLKKIHLQATSAPHSCGHVACDICTGDKNKAIKSCLVCLENYCQIHFEQHEEFHSRKPHKVADATRGLQKMICPRHEKLLEIFCRTDELCICYMCSVDEHKNHDTVTAATEKNRKQRELETTKITNQKRIEEKEKDLEDLRAAVEFYKRSAQAAVDNSERIFTELIHSIEKSHIQVIELIRDQEKIAVNQAKEQLERLQQEIEDLRRRNTELEKLSRIQQHHITFLQSFLSLSDCPTNSSRITVSARLNFNDVVKSVQVLREKLDHFCTEEIEKTSENVRYITIIPTSIPKNNKEFLQYSCQLTLDTNTVNKNLLLSGRNEAIDFSRTVQPYLSHPERFDNFPQVLCIESVCGRSYWEVEWKGWVGISVSYKSISRKGTEGQCEFGRNDQSWCLYCFESSCSFWHKNTKIKLPGVSSSSRIGVFVDYAAGTLSFYSVSDTMSLIHKVHTTFTEPLCPGFWAGGFWSPVSNITLYNITRE